MHIGKEILLFLAHMYTMYINTRSLEGTGFALLRNDLAKSGDARARAVLNVTKLSRLNVRKL